MGTSCYTLCLGAWKRDNGMLMGWNRRKMFQIKPTRWWWGKCLKSAEYKWLWRSATHNPPASLISKSTPEMMGSLIWSIFFRNNLRDCQCNQCLQTLWSHARKRTTVLPYNGLPQHTCCLGPGKIERNSIANWGRGQNTIIKYIYILKKNIWFISPHLRVSSSFSKFLGKKHKKVF